MCIRFGIVPIKAPMPDRLSAYFAGFFDADGTMGVYLNPKGYPRIMISVTNKFRVDVQPFLITFGGIIYEDGRGLSVWKISSKADVLVFLGYYKSIDHFKSFKSTKFLLIEEYYELMALRAWKPDSVDYPRWVIHYAKWCRKGYDDGRS